MEKYPGQTIVVSGRLQVVLQQGDEGEQLLLELGRGQTVGEMGLFTGGKRTASVRTMRDTLLAKLSFAGFNRLLRTHPEAITRHFAGKVIDRLWLQTIGKAKKQSNVANIAIIPTHADVPLSEFTASLAKVLESHGPTLHISSRLLDNHLSPRGIAQKPLDDPNSINIARWLNKQESVYRYILYETDTLPTEWTERCLRQADRVLLVGQAGFATKLGAIESS